MKSEMTRWKIVPLYSDFPETFSPVLGLVKSIVPLDKPMKLATVLGADLGKSSTVMSPLVVLITAVASVIMAEGVDIVVGVNSGVLIMVGDGVMMVIFGSVSLIDDG